MAGAIACLASLSWSRPSARLARWTLRHRTRCAFSGKREAGTGPGVVRLHSNASTSAQWHNLMNQLSPQFHVLAPDLLDAGKGPAWPANQAVSLGDEVRLLETVFARAGVTRWSWSAIPTARQRRGWLPWPAPAASAPWFCTSRRCSRCWSRRRPAARPSMAYARLPRCGRGHLCG